MKRKRVLVILLAMLLLTATITSCSGDAPADTTTPDDTQSTPADVAEPEDQETPTVSILLQGDNTPAEDNLVLQKLGEETNTIIDMTYVPGADFAVKVNTLAAGDDLTDIFPSDINQAQEFKEAGMIADVSAFLDGAPNLMDNVGDLLEDSPVNTDGTYLIVNPILPWADQLAIRTDWLTNLGMEMPTNLDELYDTFYAFTYEDPDGNGENDTFGLCANTSPRTFSTIFGAYGIPQSNNIILDDGTVTTWVKHPNFLDAMEYNRTLLADGLIEPDWATIPTIDMFGKLWDGTAGALEWESVGTTNNWMPSRYTEDPVPTFDFPIIEGADGTAGVAEKFAAVMSGYVFSADADIEAGMRVADYCSTPEGADLLYLGVEDVMYQWVDKEAGTFEYLGDYVDSAVHRAEGGFCYWALFAPTNNTQFRTLNTQTREAVQEAWDNSLDNTANVIAVLDTRTEYGADMDQIIAEMYAELLITNDDLQSVYDTYMERWQDAGGTEWEAELNEAWEAQGSVN